MPVPAVAVAWWVGGLVAALSRMFASRIGAWVAGLLVFLGVGLAANGLVVQPLLDELDAIVQSNVGGAGAEAVAMLAFLNFDKALTMIFSAYAARAAVAAGKVALVKR